MLLVHKRAGILPIGVSVPHSDVDADSNAVAQLVEVRLHQRADRVGRNEQRVDAAAVVHVH